MIRILIFRSDFQVFITFSSHNFKNPFDLVDSCSPNTHSNNKCKANQRTTMHYYKIIDTKSHKISTIIVCDHFSTNRLVGWEVICLPN